MRKKSPTSLKLIVLLTLMPICGISTVIATVFVLMNVGLFLEDNYELLFGGSKGIIIIAVAFSVGGIIPVLLLWRWMGQCRNKVRH